MGMDHFNANSKAILYITFGFYIVSVVLAILRVMSMVLRSKSVRWYDLLMVVTFTLYSGFLGVINLSLRTKANLLLSVTQVESVLSDPEDVRSRIIGSILVTSVEQSMLLTLWGVKWSILVFMYPFANQEPKGRIILQLIAGYTFICFFVFEMLYFGVLCVPFSQYWAVPVTNIQCTTYSSYHKIQLAFNVTTDCLIMGMASAILARLEASAQQKFMVCSLLALGVITVVTAVGNKLIKINTPEDLSYVPLYIMETSVAIWVSNAMYCWPVIQKLLQWNSLGHFRSFYVVRTPGPTRIAPQPEQGREVSWWRELVARIKGRSGAAAEQDVEMNDRAPTTLPPGRHAMSASRGTTILMHTELSDYLENGPATPHSQALTRDNDTSPALIYREINKLN